MLLAINANNTNTSFCIFAGDEIRAAWRAAANAKSTGDEHAAWLAPLMALEGMTLKDVDAVIIATVVPEMLFNLKTLCRKYFKSEPMVLGEPGVDPGVEVKVEMRKEDIGADRL